MKIYICFHESISDPNFSHANEGGYLLVRKKLDIGLYECDLFIVNSDGGVRSCKNFTRMLIEKACFESKQYMEHKSGDSIEVSKIKKFFYSLVTQDNSYYWLVNLLNRRKSISFFKKIKDISILNELDSSPFIKNEIMNKLIFDKKSAYAFSKGVRYVFSLNKKDFFRRTEIKNLNFILEHESTSYEINLDFDHGILGRIPINIFIGKNGTGKSFSIRKISERYIKSKDNIIHEDINKVIIISNTIHDNYISNYASYPRGEEWRQNIGYEYFSSIKNKKFTPELGVQTTSLIKSVLSMLERDASGSYPFDCMGVFESKIKENLRCDCISYYLKNGDVVHNYKELSRNYVLDFDGRGISRIVFLKKGKELILSSGQRNYIDVIGYILSSIENNSVIFIDELENFLHPNIIIDALRIMKELLLLLNSVCVIATHSLFIAREIPSSGVSVFIRDDKSDEMYTVHPNFESYSCSLQKISDYIFNSGQEKSIFDGTLKVIAEKFDSKRELFNQYAGTISDEILLSISDKINENKNSK